MHVSILILQCSVHELVILPVPIVLHIATETIIMFINARNETRRELSQTSNTFNMPLHTHMLVPHTHPLADNVGSVL